MMKIIAFVAAIAFVAVTGEADKRCRDGWIFFRESCYYIGDAGLSYDDAAAACNAMGADLATLAYQGENDFIKSQLQNDDATGAWFDYVFYDSSGDLKWNNKYSQKQSFQDWHKDMEPCLVLKRKSRDSRRRLLCAALTKQRNWAWSAFDCDDTTGMKYVCEGCTIDQVCTSRTCFRLDCQRTSKYSAQTKCENLGGSLATIRSQEENDAVKDHLNQVRWGKDGWGKPGSGVWLAGSDSLSEGRWYWGSDRDTSTWTFSDWRLPNEPNNGGWGNDAENCVVMSPNDWRWNDVPCRQNHFPLCEIPNVNPITG